MLLAASKNVDITAPIGLAMAGFEEREHGSTGILNPLQASVLVLACDKSKVAIVTLDVGGIDNNLVKEVRERVSAKTDIDSAAIMICATHTHSGPTASRLGVGSMFPMENVTPADEHYYANLIETLAGAIIWVNDELEEATISSFQTELLGIGSNRIEHSRYCNNNLTVLKVENKNGELLSILCHYACHPTILNYENFLYSGDYISFYREALRKIYPQAGLLFVQGCAGNVSTRHYRKGFGQAEAARMGKILAGGVLRALMMADPLPVDSLSFAIEPLELKVRDFDSEEVCLAKIKFAEDEMARLKAENAPVNIQRTAYVEWQGATRYYRRAKKINSDKIASEMQVLKIGNWQIISTPGETFGEIGLAISKLSATPTIVSGYTNDSVSYIPTKETYDNPVGYEVNVAIVARDSEDRILEAAESLLKKV